MNFNSTSSSSNYNNQLPTVINQIDERDQFLKLKQIHQKKLYIPDLHNILKEYLNLTSSTSNRPSEDWRAHIILENFQNRALTTWSLEKIEMGFIAAVNDDDVSLLSVLLEITQIRKINMNTLFPNTPETEYEVDGNNFKLNFLHLAVHKKKHSALQYMLESNLFDVNFKTCSLNLKSDKTPLHFAIINLDAIAIKLLLGTLGINPKIPDINNHTPFDELLTKNTHNTKATACIELFRNGLPENTFLEMCNGLTLIAACNAKLNELTKYLIPRLDFFNVNYQPERYGMTPLFCAVLNHLEGSVIQAFLDHPAEIDVNIRSLYQPFVITPLHLAVKINNMRALTILVNHPKTNVNKTEDCFNNFTLRIDGTPLFSAVRLNNVEAVKILLEHKADLLSRSYEKICYCDNCRTPRYGSYINTFQMAQHNQNSEILKLLHEAKEKQ